MKIFLMLLLVINSALGITLQWDHDIEADLAGYKLYWGPESGSPSQHHYVGNVVQFTVDDGELPMGSTIYFTATALNIAGWESEPSNEVAYEVPIATSGAQFVKTDISAQGTWKGNYGQDGYAIASDETKYPVYAAVNISGQRNWVWSLNTPDVRALQKVNHETERIAACWYQVSFTIDVSIMDGLAHEIALYCLDWDKGGRAQNVRIVDAGTGATLDNRNISAFEFGKYLVYKVKGHFKIIVTRLAGPNAVIGGIFFGTRIAAPTNLHIP